MSLNWAMLDDKREPVPLPNETQILSIPSGVDLTLKRPGVSEGSTLNAVGALWVTDQRLVFVSNNERPALRSLSVQLPYILSTTLSQPVFGANYFSAAIRPAMDGGLTDGSRIEIRLKDKGIYELVGTIEKTRERAIYMRRNAQEADGDALPIYEASETDREPASQTITVPPVLPGITGVASDRPSENPPSYDASH